MLAWSTKWKWYAEYSADSVEWCPVEPHFNVFVCGTYQLEQDSQQEPKSSQKRKGKIYLFSIDEKTHELIPSQTIDTAGVLDQKWCHHKIQGYPILAVSTSNASCQLYKLITNGELKTLKLWTTIMIESDVLALSVDWSTNKSPCDQPLLVLSDSSGCVSLYSIGNDVQKLNVFKSHDYEAWIAAFDYWDANVVYSGGDDCLFKCYDTRASGVVNVNRAHEAGVTSIQSHVNIEHRLITGSYDEKVRLWDTRNLKRNITEATIGGGVWRLKWSPFDDDCVLSACMYGGFRTMHINTDIKVTSEYLEHESIGYGADWMYVKPYYVATCSFYDRLLHVSEIASVLA